MARREQWVEKDQETWRNRLETRVVAAAALSCVAIACHAGRPLATEDANILDQKECEWESFAARETSSGSPAVGGWTTQLGCGVGHATQLAVAYSHAQSEWLRAQGLALVEKTGLIDRKDGAIGLALAWAVGSETTTGSSSFKHELSQLNLAATMEFAKNLTTSANLGWLRSKNARALSTTWNLATE